MEEHEIGWLHRRAGWGAHPDDIALAAGRDDALAEFLDPGLTGIEPSADPWEQFDLDPEDGGRREAIIGWLSHLFTTRRPYEARRTWMLHGWLVSSMAKVPSPEFMVDQVRLFDDFGGGSYPELLKSITIDRAMLVYLDGRTSTGDAPNENYGRELLELFALGVGSYTEDDVSAAARALTGWVVGPNFDEALFIPRRHDDTPQMLVGTGGVNDVDSVVDAVVAHPAHAEFVARRLVTEYLGDPEDERVAGAVTHLADIYVDNDLALDPVIGAALELAVGGIVAPMVVAPIPWLVSAVRITAVDPRRLVRGAQDHLREMGQLPLLPPDVSGWPTGEEWFTASSLIARIHVAATIAELTAPGEPLRVALEDGEFDLAAQHLGHREPFGPATVDALRATQDPVDRLTLALVSPENLLT